MSSTSVQTQFSAGGIVYKKEKHQIYYLLRLPKANPEYTGKIVWTLPKGWLDDTSDGKSPGPLGSGKARATQEQIQAAALKEVVEETGVKAKIIDKLATIKFFFKDQNHKQILKFVTYYLMAYVRNLPQGPGPETETATWFPYKEARTKLAYSNEKQLIDQAQTYISSPKL